MNLITTIIPTYNRSKFLKQAINSVLSQTYKNLKILVLDNASTDDTPKLIQEMQCDRLPIEYYRHSENIGSRRNFEFGLNFVNTPFFSFLADDDLLLPWFYQEAIQIFEKNPDLALFSGATIKLNEKGEIHAVLQDSWPNEGLFNSADPFLRASANNFSNWISILFNKRAIQESCRLDPKIEIFDTDFLLRILCKKPRVFISKTPCAIFRMHPASSSTTLQFKAFWPSLALIASNIQQEKIAEELKQSFIKTYYKATRLSLFKLLLTTLERYDFYNAKKCIILITKRFGQYPCLCLFLIGFIKIIRFSLFYPLLFCLSSIKKSCLWYRKLRLNRRYGQFLKYINDLEAFSKDHVKTDK